MLNEVKITDWVIGVDLEKTAEFYQNELEVCDCLYCRNFAGASLLENEQLYSILKKLGINAATPNHVSFFPTDDKEKLLYIGNYPFTGKVLKGELCSISNWNETNTLKIENFAIGFSEELELVPEDFSEPVIQVNFEAIMPWVLDELPEEE